MSDARDRAIAEMERFEGAERVDADETTEERIRGALLSVEQDAVDAVDLGCTVTPEWGPSIATVARVMAEEIERLHAQRFADMLDHLVRCHGYTVTEKP